MTPQLVDLNADGHQDIVVATFEGTAFLVAGSEDGWKEPVHIKDENDTNVRIGMYYDLEEKNYSTVDRSTDDYESNDNHHMTAISVVDWDNDGDFDLILGAHEGGLYRCMNLGSKTEPKFSATNQQIMAGDKPMQLDSLTTPRIVDWDDDGQWDMLLGTVEGDILLHRNIGEAGKPKFAEKPDRLINVSTTLSQKIQLDGATLSGITDNPYMEAVDYDQDGDLDLLVGAHSKGEQEQEELSDEDKDKLAKLKTEQKSLGGKIEKLLDGVESNEAFKEIYEDPENKPLFERQSELYQEIEELEPYFRAPHLIWLFRNKRIENSKPSVKENLPKKATTSFEPPADFDSTKFEIRASLHNKAADGTATLVVHVNVPKGKHIYGPNNSMIPTTLAIDETEGVSLLGDADIPSGRLKMSGAEQSWWLEDVVTITQSVKISPDAKSISGHIRYMVCDETMCRPPTNEKFSVSIE